MENIEINKNMKTVCKNIFIILLLSFITEIIVFNVRFFQSLTYDEISVSEENTLSIENGHLTSTGDIELDDADKPLRVTVGNIKKHLDNLKIDVAVTDESVDPDLEDHVCNVSVAVWDEALHEKIGDDGNTYLENGMYELTSKKVLHGVDASQYIWLETFGNVNAVQLDIFSASGKGKVFRIEDIRFNTTAPLDISIPRFLIIFVILTIIYLSLFEKRVWSIDCVTYARWKVVLPVILLIAAAVFSFVWVAANPLILNDPMNEYALLARAMLRGECHVGEGGELIKSMAGKSVFWNIESKEIMFDYSYYDGKYYVYFGVLPCLIFFVPYCFITGNDLPNYVPVLILCLAVLSEMYIFTGMLIRRYYRNTPYMARLLMTGAAAGGMYLPLFVSLPSFYLIAILAGVALILAGAMFWIKGEGTKPGYMAAGSACMAAVSLCRPTLLLLGLVFLVILMTGIRKVIISMERRNIIRLGLALALPYIIFGIICMYYNYIRFDSPFDFGVHGNLTTIPFNGGDGFWAYQLVRTLYECLFAPAVFSPEYPFVAYQWKQLTEAGSLLAVDNLGIGLFTASPVLWSVILCFVYRKSLQKKGLWNIIISMLICTFILMFFSTRFTFFVTSRYSLEFSMIYFLLSFIGIMEFMTDIRAGGVETRVNAVRFMFSALLLYSFFFGMLQILQQDGLHDLLYGNTELYYKIYYGANFML